MILLIFRSCGARADAGALVFDYSAILAVCGSLVVVSVKSAQNRSHGTTFRINNANRIIENGAAIPPIPLTNIPLTMVFSLNAFSKNRQRNVRQRNNLRLCLFPIPLPNIPKPILSLFVCCLRAVPLQ
jgi:hypothetical protein